MLFNRQVEDNEASTSELISRVGNLVARATGFQSDRKCALIDACLNIKGDLETDSDVLVDGQIDGNVRCAHLTVGKDGAVNGDIDAREVLVRGSVKGAIRADRVMLMGSALVAGDISYESMSIEEGASFRGASNRGKDESRSDSMLAILEA
jgi:cytoskeletal protein CcmA (bactofilin family)